MFWHIRDAMMTEWHSINWAGKLSLRIPQKSPINSLTEKRHQEFLKNVTLSLLWLWNDAHSTVNLGPKTNAECYSKAGTD
jgi:hypothetical protein